MERRRPVFLNGTVFVVYPFIAGGSGNDRHGAAIFQRFWGCNGVTVRTLSQRTYRRDQLPYLTCRPRYCQRCRRCTQDGVQLGHAQQPITAKENLMRKTLYIDECCDRGCHGNLVHATSDARHTYLHHTSIIRKPSEAHI